MRGISQCFPFLVSTGFDQLVDSHVVHVGYGPQRWSLTSTQARQLASALLHAAVDIDRTSRDHRGA